MDKHLSIKLNASRKVTGILRGYDQFMNMVRTCERHPPTSARPVCIMVGRGGQVFFRVSMVWAHLKWTLAHAPLCVPSKPFPAQN
jgi:small nuclear ribonucleoprotein G